MTQIAEISTKIRKRNGSVVDFDGSRIFRAIAAAFCTTEWGIPKGSILNAMQEQIVTKVHDEVIEKIEEAVHKMHSIDVEWIQDMVELILMRQGYYAIAKEYILYRQNRAKARQLHSDQDQLLTQIKSAKGESIPFYSSHLKEILESLSIGIREWVDLNQLANEIKTQLFELMTEAEIIEVCILVAKSHIEQEPAYDTLAARFLLFKLDQEIHGTKVSFDQRNARIKNHFKEAILEGIQAKRMDAKLENFDLDKLSNALEPERDFLFDYLGLQTLYDRYLIHVGGKHIETPQTFWMRIAMGLSLNEADKEEKAISFYNIISTFRYCPATPTLFNSGTVRPQLSSCFLLTCEDDLDAIFKMISDNARLSKWSGGLGNDWTNIRATNACIHGTNGSSQGIIPFLKVANDTTVAVNQGGKRKGVMCAYLETWHLDIEDFLDLRKNTGDERRRTHDMNTANWIPDLFMKRVEENGEWTLFNPSDVPDLHQLYGKAFEERYVQYEEDATRGKISLFKKIPAQELWRKMLSRLFETGHPWITWKDPSNIRSSQKHCGVVNSSNLCTEILLNTSKDETAVCNLGSINFVKHIREGKLDLELLEETIRYAMRMLDNVIDINFYPTKEALQANSRHRPVGLGIMGFQDALHALNLSYSSEEAVDFADFSTEAISYYAISSSIQLAKERGAYTSYKGSLWEKGFLPIDTLTLLENERGQSLNMDRHTHLNWSPVRKSLQQYGMRNSQVMAIAPTATISQIIGVSQSIEPLYAVLHAKSNLSGDFTYVNKALVHELKKHGLWDLQMLEEIKYQDGSIQSIARIPNAIRDKFKTAFEIGFKWVIRSAAKRQKWIDMGQSLNLYLAEPSGKKLDEMYFYAWKCGLKTTYYLRTRAATQVEKSTLDINRFGIQPKWMKNKSASSAIEVQRTSCSLDNTSCEACQ